MDIEGVREYCMSLKATTESLPFDETTLVFKVLNKMYCLESLNRKSINLKATPENVISLIEEYQGIIPGYHMSKVHWVTVKLDEFNDNDLLKQLILDSYELIVSKMTKKAKLELEQL